MGRLFPLGPETGTGGLVFLINLVAVPMVLGAYAFLGALVPETLGLPGVLDEGDASSLFTVCWSLAGLPLFFTCAAWFLNNIGYDRPRDLLLMPLEILWLWSAPAILGLVVCLVLGFRGGLAELTLLAAYLGWGLWRLALRPIYRRLRAPSDDSRRSNTIRGSELLQEEDLRQIELTPHARRIYWGGYEFPMSHLAAHFGFVGTTGSGKTLGMRMLMRSALLEEKFEQLVSVGPEEKKKRRFGRKSKEEPVATVEQKRTLTGELKARGFVFDPKGDMPRNLLALGVKERDLRITNPLLEGSYAWDIQKDVTDLPSADTVAGVLCPRDEHTNNPFFSETPRLLVASVLEVFVEKQDSITWYLSDVVEACLDKDKLKLVLQSTKSGRQVWKTYFGDADAKTASNLMASLVTKMRPLSVVTGLWRKSLEEGRSFSLAEWLDSKYIIVVGLDEANREALEAINRALFARAAQLLVSLPDNHTAGETWMFLDEVRLAGKLKQLHSLLLMGRSKQTRVAIGIQDVEGLTDVYGAQQASEMLGQLGNLALMRMTNPQSQEWASRVIGAREFWQMSTTEGVSFKGGPNSSVSYGVRQHQSVMASEFGQLELPATDSLLSGFYTTPKGAWRNLRLLSLELIRIESQRREVQRQPSCLRRAGAYRRIQWVDDDLARLDLSRSRKMETPG